MYSDKVTQTQIEKIEAATKTRLHRYPVGDVLDWVPTLTRIWNDGKPTRPFTNDEHKFIRNEQILSKLDFNYWSERYSTLMLGGINETGIGKLKMWESQRLILQSMAKLEEKAWEQFARNEPVDGILIALNKSRQLGACLVAGTRVLKADLRWVPIETVKSGDDIIAFDELTPSGKGVHRKLRKARVTGTCSMVVPTVKVLLNDGTILHGTPHHKFLTYDTRKHRGALHWKELKDMQPGDQVRRVMSPWDDGESFEDGWFGGFLDGEGSCRAKHHGGSELCGSQVDGHVLNRALNYLYARGYSPRIETDNRTAGTSSKLGSQVVYKLVLNRLSDIFRAIGQSRPIRFLERTDWYEGKELPKDGQSYAEVVSVERAEKQRVYDLQTTTKTYIAEGFASHNTAISRSVIMHRLTLWDHAAGFSASVDDDKVAELYQRDKRIYDNLPFYLRPSLDPGDGSIDQQSAFLKFGKLDTSILYQTSNQKSGLGQGRKFDVYHITECASFEFDGRGFAMLEHDLFPTIPQTPYTFCIAESTPQGRGTAWHLWCELIESGMMARWTYLFVPVYVEKDAKYRRTPPIDWTPNATTMAYAQKVESTSPQVIGYKFTPARDHLYWYETTRKEYAERGTLNIFLTNFAATSSESFQFQTDAAFSADLLLDLERDIVEPVTYEFEPAYN